MGKRNAYALAAMQRKAGAHSEAKRPRDICDAINEYTDEQCAELQERKRGFDVGDRVQNVVFRSAFYGCEGLVVKRDENINGDPVWTVDFEGAGMLSCLTYELERVY